MIERAMSRAVRTVRGLLVGLLGTLALWIGATTSRAEVPVGQDVFLAKKCNLCHAIESQGIEKRSKSDSAATQGADLSDVGNRYDGEWLKAYLTKKETLNDKVHKKGFRGTDDELQALVVWLVGLKLGDSENAEEADASGDST